MVIVFSVLLYLEKYVIMIFEQMFWNTSSEERKNKGVVTMQLEAYNEECFLNELLLCLQEYQREEKIVVIKIVEHGYSLICSWQLNQVTADNNIIEISSVETANGDGIIIIETSKIKDVHKHYTEGEEFEVSLDNNKTIIFNFS